MDTEKTKIEDGTLIIPEGTEILEWGEYAGRTDFSRVSFPESLTYIDGNAFSDCTALKEVTIPKSVTEVGQGAFINCTELEKLVVLGDNTKFESGWDCVFNGCCKLKDISMTTAAWELNKQLNNRYEIAPIDGLSAYDVLMLKLAQQTEQLLNKPEKPESKYETIVPTTIQASIIEKNDIFGSIGSEPYFLSINLTNDNYKRQVKGFDIEVLMCQSGFNWLIMSPYIKDSNPVLVLSGVGKYRIKDSFNLKKGESVTKEYFVVHRPNGSKQPDDRCYPALVAIYCFRVRAVFATEEKGKTVGKWTSRYVSEIGKGYRYRFYESFDFDISSEGSKCFEKAATYFLKIGAPTGKHLMGIYTEELTDQAELSKIAKSNPHASVRYRALMKIEDQSTIAFVAQNDPRNIIRDDAIKKLKDQAVLLNIALNKQNWYFLRETAMEKLEDKKALVKIALKDPDERVREAAVENIDDQKLLAKIALKDRDMSVRETAIDKLEDESVLEKIAHHRSEIEVRSAAERRLQILRKTNHLHG